MAQTLMLTRTTSHSLTEQLAERFASRIRDRLLLPGARLPSVRECARQQGVSPYTVVAAYDQLLAQGLVEARRQRGFFVRDAAQKVQQTTDKSRHAATNSEAKPPAAGRAAVLGEGALDAGSQINATALIRGMFHQASSKPQPGSGVFPPDWLETPFLAAAVRKVTGGPMLHEHSLKYGEPKGDPQLREVLAQRLAAIHIPVSPRQIITSVGATHALDIVSRTLLKAGDCVMVEEPGWAVEFARLDALGMRILPVPRGPAGPDIEVMARYCEVHAPKLFVSVSVLHNPTGACLSPASAHRVLQLAQQHDFWIAEDDSYSHLAPAHATRLAQLDGLNRTIYVGGFSKILAPDWRVGFLAAPPELTEPLLDTKLLTTLTSPSLLERALAHCIEQGQLRRHAERIRARLDTARSRSVKLALQAGCRFAAEPAGLFGWVDTGVDTEQLEKLIKEHKPKFVYLIPTFGNPSGAMLSLERRKRVLELAVKYQTLIVEDDPYGDLYFGECAQGLRRTCTGHGQRAAP